MLFLLFYFNVAIELEASCITIWPEAVGAQRPTASSSNLDTRIITIGAGDDNSAFDTNGRIFLVPSIQIMYHNYQQVEH